ncbi:hypothetical protein N1851_023448 [Merluccius polli]|uniref:Uncharacterized protein n=1 Tax=Merluccius polli TaxID=89951 RepID=A0AA47NXJ9_MERPO|nr:hypothetical protein N1851_023448 [Merluccius polli]
MCHRAALARSLRRLGSDPADWTRAAGRGPSKRTDLPDLPDPGPGPGPGPCLALRGGAARRLRCGDPRSFNYNPFGLRFGKRFLPALARPRTLGFLPVFLDPQDLEGTT